MCLYFDLYLFHEDIDALVLESLHGIEDTGVDEVGADLDPLLDIHRAGTTNIQHRRAYPTCAHGVSELQVDQHIMTVLKMYIRTNSQYFEVIYQASVAWAVF